MNNMTPQDDTRGGNRARVRRLPSLEAATNGLMDMLRDPDVSDGQVLELLSRDISLSSNILAVANSPYYGLSREVASLRMAMRLLGFEALRNLVYAVTIQRLFRQGRLCEGFDARCLWHHASTSGALARRLAQTCGGVDPQAAFLAGLLHDVGHIVAAQISRQSFCKVLCDLRSATPPAGERTRAFLAAERAVHGVDHAALGAEALEAWRFPEWTITVVARHHDKATGDDDQSSPDGSPEDQAMRRLIEVVRLGDALSATLPGSFALDLDADAQVAASTAVLGLDPAAVGAIHEEVARTSCGSS